VDLKEPVKASYSEEEAAELKHKFILLVHSLLLLYLALHNLIIPMGSNLLRGDQPFLDVHFWFLIHLPLHFWLRTGREVPQCFYLFLLVGSLSRLMIELMLMTSLKSWTIFSVVISEFSTLLFLYVGRVKFTCYRSLARSMGVVALGLLLPLSMSHLEARSNLGPRFFLKKEDPTLIAEKIGCQEGIVELALPQSHANFQHELEIKTCGFKENLVFISQNFILKNSFESTLNVRLFKLDPKGRRVRWKFVRLVQLAPREVWDLSPLIKTDGLYLVKIPERRNLGFSVLVPDDFKTPEAGKLIIGFDSVEWHSLENEDD
jgi:hypothetical protein